MLKIGKKSYKNIGIYNIDTLQLKKLMIMKTFSVNRLYLMIGKAIGH